MKLQLLLVILGVIFGDTGHFGGQSEELVRGVGAWMFLLHQLPAERPRWWSVSLGQEEGKRGSLWAEGSQVGRLESWTQWGRVTFLVLGFPEKQLLGTSCLALSKPFFLSEPAVSFLANGGANFYHEVVARIK